MRPALRIAISREIIRMTDDMLPHHRLNDLLDRIEKAIEADRENRMLERRGGRAR